jgi:hypothetical protein
MFVGHYELCPLQEEYNLFNYAAFLSSYSRIHMLLCWRKRPVRDLEGRVN